MIHGWAAIQKARQSIEERTVGSITRGDVNEEWAHSGYVEAGDFVFLSYCVGNVGKSVEEQINGALDHMETRLAKAGLKLSDVAKLDILLRDVWNIPIMEKVFKERFRGIYPARKTISTDFAHVGGPEGLHVQIDGIAYRGKKE
jgi:enamine deaminase RidA (YjgF/YER057c/UK114 family)